MDQLEKIAEKIHQEFEAHTDARDKALNQARTLTRNCALAIRAIHREEKDTAGEHLEKAALLADDCAPDAQGLDLPATDRRQEDGRLLALPSGPIFRHGKPAGSCQPP